MKVILLVYLAGYSINSVFDEYTGFWVAREENVTISTQFERQVNLSSITSSQKEVVTRLSSSIYGSQELAFENIPNNRYIITIR